MSALCQSFDPDEPETTRHRDDRKAIEAGGFGLFHRFVRGHNSAHRWDRMPADRRQGWIEDFEAGLRAYRAAGGR
ncbi:hypothetical protein DYI37_03355 [Fulvimarina endophytica]|uniref:Uncharacterized protein n=1 Tax=Fulvimarina endophytica TaxID=2293836 RepID=A0A371XBC5_9HYPH|nr:hypothetical protein [Fulvimarina endophytica]RFC66491.1 hypothetical protein DYI37_03355 [Fulvimarina endophytica]